MCRHPTDPDSDAEKIRLLLNAGAAVHVVKSCDGMTALHWACHHGAAGVVAALMQHVSPDGVVADALTKTLVATNAHGRWPLDLAGERYLERAAEGPEAMAASIQMVCSFRMPTLAASHAFKVKWAQCPCPARAQGVASRDNVSCRVVRSCGKQAMGYRYQGGGLAAWAPSPDPPTHPPTHIRKLFLRKKMKFIKGARIWRSVFGRQTFFWPLRPPSPRVQVLVAAKPWPGRKVGTWGLAAHGWRFGIPQEKKRGGCVLCVCVGDNFPTGSICHNVIERCSTCSATLIY